MAVRRTVRLKTREQRELEHYRDQDPRPYVRERCGTRNLKRDERMKKEYDFSKAKRGAILPTTGKTRITLYLDNEVLEHFRDLSEKTGRGYQTLINEALSAYTKRTEPPLTSEAVRRIVREELALQG